MSTPSPPSQPRSSLLGNLARAALIVAFGATEGYALHASGITAPVAVRGQMVFDAWVVMKMFMGAVGASLLTQVALSMYSKDAFERTRQHSTSNVGLLRMVSGSSMVGIGMALAGAGPTIVPAQIVAGATGAVYTLMGMFAGGLIFGVVEKAFSLRTSFNTKDAMSLDKRLGVSYASVAAPMGLLLCGAAGALEVAFPNAVDANRLRLSAVPPLLPTVAGIVIGLNQWPLRTIGNKGQGGSTPVMNVIATATGGALSRRLAIDSFEKSYQLLFVYVGSALGAFLAVTQYPALTGPPSLPPAVSFVGGMVMLFGARIANGCTCGVGISGVSELSVLSMVGAASIFGCGIATGLLLKALGVN